MATVVQVSELVFQEDEFLPAAGGIMCLPGYTSLLFRMAGDMTSIPGCFRPGSSFLQDDMLNFPYRTVGNIKHTISYELYT